MNHLREAGQADQIVYSTHSEEAFDDAIFRADFDRAREIIMTLNDALTDATYGTDDFPAEEPHLELKELALPMYMLAEADATGKEYPGNERDIRRLYHATTCLIDYYRETLEYLDSQTLDERGREKRMRVIGAKTELIIFGLIVRAFLPGKAAPYTIVPTSKRMDQGYQGPDNKRTGTDFIIQARDTLRTVLAQVKTGAITDEYAEGIMMVSLAHIAGGEANIEILQQAMYDESIGYETPVQLILIEQAVAKLTKKIERHLAHTAFRSAA